MHVQGECRRLALSMQELETRLSDMVTDNEELREQLDDKSKKCHNIEVYYHSMHAYSLHTVSACT